LFDVYYFNKNEVKITPSPTVNTLTSTKVTTFGIITTGNNEDRGVNNLDP